MYTVIDDPVLTANTLNRDLESVLHWSKTWLVSFNQAETETVLFSRKANKPVHSDLHFNRTLLSPVTDHKHLSFTLSDDFRWKAYITSSVNKAWQSLRLLRFVTYLLNRRYLQRLHVTFIRPLLEYGDMIWDCFEQMKTVY